MTSGPRPTPDPDQTVPSPSAAAPILKPVPGGVLHVVAGRDSAPFDSTTGSVATQNILRGLTRQLVSYQPGSQFSDVVGRVVADAAAEVPLPVDGRVYTFTVRAGVQWDLPTSRPVTGADFARGLKRLCSPVDGSYTATYFADVISGYSDFCTGFAKLGRTASTAQLTSYLDNHAVAGLQTPDARTLVVTLTAPAGDFLNMMALPAASALPVESLAYAPGSAAFRAHFVSDGPYTVVSDKPGRSLTLGRNPVWIAASDPIRKAYADEVRVTYGADEASAHAAITSGAADIGNDIALPAATPTPSSPSSPTSPKSPADARLATVTDGSLERLVINTRSTTAAGALGRVAVRQALAVATDKAAVVALAGGPDVAEPVDTVLTPQLLGFRPTPRSVAGDTGDPARARQLLSSADLAAGLTVHLLHADSGRDTAIAAAVGTSWRAAGITVQLEAVDDETLARVLGGSAGRRTGWDVALVPAWRPDWYGPGARTFFAPLLRSRGPLNVGSFSNAAVDALIGQALAEPDGNRAADIWAQADSAVMEQAPWVPLFTARRTFEHSARVHGWVWDGLGLPDYTNVWLSAS